jgi:hypothetical protein
VKLIIGAAITITSAANSSSTSASDCASSARCASVCGPFGPRVAATKSSPM